MGAASARGAANVMTPIRTTSDVSRMLSLHRRVRNGKSLQVEQFACLLQVVASDAVNSSRAVTSRAGGCARDGLLVQRRQIRRRLKSYHPLGCYAAPV